MDHMSVADYNRFNAQCTTTEYKSSKKTKSSHNDCPLESVESQRLAGELTRLVTMGKVIKFSHIANESKDMKANVRNKQIGVRPGCPDFLIVLPDKLVMIELKRLKGGAVSEEQKAWIAAINRAGGYATVAKGADEAIKYLEELL